MHQAFSENLFDFANLVMPSLFYETVVQACRQALVLGFGLRFVGSDGRQIYLRCNTEQPFFDRS